MDATDWTAQYDRPLAGLLGVHVDERFDASAPWLALHLHIAKSGGAARLKAALDAVASLHLLTSGTDSSTQKTRLWTRVLTSRMMTLPLRESDPKIVRFTRFLHQSPPRTAVTVVLDWTGIKVETVACPLLREFLNKERPVGTPPLMVGLVLTRCRLTAQAIEMLDAVLGDVKKAGSVGRLVDVHSLERIDLSDNGLTLKALDALATLLDHHEVRDVRLENALALADSDGTVQAVASVLRSIFSPETNHRSPVRVSLANNSLDPRYYQVVAESLAAASRPLRRLSLARTISVYDSKRREGCWQWLPGVLFTSEPTMENCPGPVACELDLSGNPLYADDLTCFEQRVQASHVTGFDAVRKALDEHKPVSCRLNSIAVSYMTPDNDAEALGVLDASVQYRVYATDGKEFARVSCDATSPARWVKYASITAIQVGDSALPYDRPRFNSLVLDEMRVQVPLWRLLVLVGSNLHRLSTRHVDVSDDLSRMLVFIPNAVHLDLEACRLSDIRAVLSAIHHGDIRALESLNVSGNPIGALSMQGLQSLYRAVPELQLRQLQVRHCHIGTSGLLHLEQILQASRALEILELDKTTRRDNEDSEYATQRERLAARHDNELIRVEPLPLPARLAFLSLAAHLPVVTPMDAPVASLVLAFAASRVTRHLLWS